MNFGPYSKLIGAFLGNLIAIIVVYLASQGLATCKPALQPDLEQVCSVAGYTTGQITSAVMFVLNLAAVYIFPKNIPNS